MMAVAHWDEERDKGRVERMRDSGQLAIDHKDLIDKFEETGDPIWWYAFIDTIREDQNADRDPEKV